MCSFYTHSLAHAEIQRNIDSYLIKTTDLMEAEALSQDSDILYSGGWRRHLNMVSEPGPGHFAQLALRQGVEEVRMSHNIR